MHVTEVAVDLRSRDDGIVAAADVEYDVLARLLNLDGVLGPDALGVDGAAVEVPTEVRRSSLHAHASEVAAYVGERLRPSATAFDVYAAGNWVMSRFNVDVPAGGSYTLTRKLVATPGTEAVGVLDGVAAP
ncbi:hypothetical protein [Micromonospora sp. NPDC005367]|uniref:hypothetical protein n=1 Tax=Micromonospora sp. NPDC005367 TaxID=3155590 RepID=UPI0033B9E074